MSNIFGFVSEKHGDNYTVIPAVKDEETGVVTVQNVSGFGDVWVMHKEGVFFEQEGGGPFCEKAMKKAEDYSLKMNNQ